MKIETNSNLKSFNSFGLHARAKKLGFISNVDDFVKFLPQFNAEENRMILGSGSNVLFTQDFDGLILVNQIKGKKVIVENENELFLHVQGGENWSDLVDYTVDKGWGGIENLSLIPGTVGAAPVQNIGAYGVELKDSLVSVEAINLQSGKIVEFSNEACDFTYRNSIFKSKQKGQFFIIGILLRLSKNPVFNLSYAPLKAFFSIVDKEKISVKDISNAVKEIRRSKLPDPEELGNAGSFFKNPVVSFPKVEELVKKYPEMPFYKVDAKHYKIAAGWLIEKAGWKGKRFGDAGVHAKQALVLVNYGKATGKEMYDLSKKIQLSVKNHFEINLETEVTII